MFFWLRRLCPRGTGILTFISLFFFNDTATTEIYTLSLHDALPICSSSPRVGTAACARRAPGGSCRGRRSRSGCLGRSEEHTSELQSRQYLVCRLLLEKKKIQIQLPAIYHTPPSPRSTELVNLIINH